MEGGGGWGKASMVLAGLELLASAMAILESKRRTEPLSPARDAEATAMAIAR